MESKKKWIPEKNAKKYLKNFWIPKKENASKNLHVRCNTRRNVACSL